MTAEKDESQRRTSRSGETPAPLIEPLQDVLAAHQRWVHSAGKEGKRAELAEAALGRATLRLVVLSEANLAGADLDRAILSSARLHGANLQGASLRGADLQEAALPRANLQGADLFETNLTGANLVEANLQAANLYLADFRVADLQRATLQRALLKEATLQDANLQGANLQGANLQGADLRGADLRRANLREVNLVDANLQGSDLQGADLHGAQLHEATFAHANLRDTDLTGVSGLLGTQLASTSVAGARLPDSLRGFAGLTTVKVLVKQSRTLLACLLLGCIVAWLAIAATTDAILLTNAPVALFPEHRVPISSAAFYRFMPVVLLGLFIYFHLHLQRLWEELAELPAVFPDGRPLDKVAYPWLVHSVLRAHVLRLRTHRLPLSRLRHSYAIILAWWLVPATLVLFWLRYLPVHDWRVTTLHITLLVASLGFAVFFHGLARTLLRGRSIRRFQHGAVAVLLAFAFHAALSFVSFGALTGMPPHTPLTSQPQGLAVPGPTSQVLQQLVPQLLIRINASPFANFAEAEVSTRPIARRQDLERGLEHVKGANLREHNLRYANAVGAFLAKADLRQADLSGADLRQADLRGARLEGAELFRTNLRGADLLFATGLTREQLAEALLDASTRLPEEFERSIPAFPSTR